MYISMSASGCKRMGWQEMGEEVLTLPLGGDCGGETKWSRSR